MNAARPPVAVDSEVAGDIPLWLRRDIARLLVEIEYGAIEIVVHGGKVMQIESRRKIRYDVAGKGSN